MARALVQQSHWEMQLGRGWQACLLAGVELRLAGTPVARYDDAVQLHTVTYRALATLGSDSPWQLELAGHPASTLFPLSQSVGVPLNKATR